METWFEFIPVFWVTAEVSLRFGQYDLILITLAAKAVEVGRFASLALDRKDRLERGVVTGGVLLATALTAAQFDAGVRDAV